MNNVLYYPFIQVPNNDWFTRVLLYWDTVGSIVPYEYTQEPERLGPRMQALLTEGLVRQVIPGQYIHRIRNFADSFMQFAEQYRIRSGFRPEQLLTLPTARIHIEKLDNIGEQLCQMGLARRVDYSWFDVEAQLGAMFMAYLAGLLSKIPQFESQPITDQKSQMDFFDTPNCTRMIVLENLLPAPSGGIAANTLARFKSKNATSLTRLRNRVESFLLQVGSVPDMQMRSQMTEAFLCEAKGEVDAIVESMRTQGWRRITLGRLLSYSVAGVTLSDAIISGSILPIIAAALGVGGAVLATAQEQGISDAFQGSFVAYAVLAKRL